LQQILRDDPQDQNAIRQLEAIEPTENTDVSELHVDLTSEGEEEISPMLRRDLDDATFYDEQIIRRGGVPSLEDAERLFLQAERSGPADGSLQNVTSHTNQSRPYRIRVNQLAKELGVESKAILAKCREEGLGEKVANHMSVLGLGLAETVREWFNGSTASERVGSELGERYPMFLEAAKAYSALPPGSYSLENFHRAMARYAMTKAGFLLAQFRTRLSTLASDLPALRQLRDSVMSYCLESLALQVQVDSRFALIPLANYLRVQILYRLADNRRAIPEEVLSHSMFQHLFRWAATSAPCMRAICIAERPIPPRHPVMKTDWPALSFAFATSAFQAVTLTRVKAAACSNEMDGGLSAAFFSSATRDSANAPACRMEVMPRTSSPTLSRSAPGPTASTTPAKSWPRPRGNRKPESTFMSPRRIFQSIGLAAAALTRTRI